MAAVVVVALAAAYAVTRDDDEPGGSPRSPESSQTTQSSQATEPSQTTESSPTTSTSPSVTAAPAGGRKQRALASMAAAFAEQPGITLDQARCVARTTIEAVGLQRLADIGMFDSTMTFQDVDLAAYPDVKDALTSATFTCVVG